MDLRKFTAQLQVKQYFFFDTIFLYITDLSEVVSEDVNLCFSTMNLMHFTVD